MNYAKYIKSGILALAVLAGTAMTSCENTLDLGTTHGPDYGVVDGVFGYVRDLKTERMTCTVDIHDGETLHRELYLGLTKVADKGIDVTLKIDADYAKIYNAEHKTSFELYPALERVSLEEDGVVVVAPGDRKSGTVAVSIAKNDRVLMGKTYILPIVAEAKTDGVKLSSDSRHFVLLIRNVGVIPDTSKGSVKTVLYFEVNDTNPLNAVEFRMKDSGKPFWDVVILFAANINYNTDTKRAYVKNNPNVQFLLDNHEQYIKPLQDMGTKVLLAILNNGDRAGVAQLGDEMARDFAQELKAICEAYDLDGVNFDDEYAGAPQGPGFVAASWSAAARLCYETKRAMPDKLVSVFAYNYMSQFSNQFDGMLPGDYVDFAVPNYESSGSATISPFVSPSDFRGMEYSQCGGHSIELRRNSYADAATLRKMRTDGYGYQMSFSLDPSLYFGQVMTLQAVATALYDDQLVAPTHCYRKNSTERILLSAF